MYALKYKDKFYFLCVSKTPAEFEKKKQDAFSKWKGLQAKGSGATIDSFLSGFVQVRITVEPL